MTEFTEGAPQEMRESPSVAEIDYTPIRLIFNNEDRSAYIIEANDYVHKSFPDEDARHVYGPENAKAAEDAIVMSILQHFNHRYDRASSEIHKFAARLLVERGDIAPDKLKDEEGNERSTLNFETYTKVDEFLNSQDPDAIALINALHHTDNPHNALQFLLNNPELESIELANTIHPLNWQASLPMHSAVREAILRIEEIVNADQVDLPEGSQKVIYPVNCSQAAMQTSLQRKDVTSGSYKDSDNNSWTILFQLHTSRLHAYLPGQDIAVVERFNYIIDFQGLNQAVGNAASDEEKHELHELLDHLSMYIQHDDTHRKMISEPVGLEAYKDKQGRKDEVGKIIYDILTKHPSPVHHPWLQPAVTSYYAARNSKHAKAIVHN